MQKLQLAIMPKLYSKEERSTGVSMKLSLVSGNLCGMMGLERLIANIETNILAVLNWSRVEELASIIKRYKIVKQFKQLLEILYNIVGNIESEMLKHLKTAILREAEIRLFNCNLEIKKLISKDQNL